MAGADERSRVTKRDLARCSSFAELMRLRLGDGLQVKAAEAMNVSQTRVSRWLTGGLPDRVNLGAVADWLGISEQDLFEFIRAHHDRPTRLTQGERLRLIEDAIVEMRRELDQLRAERGYAPSADRRSS